MDTAIDWSLLASSIGYYKNKGYQYREVPWKVPVSYMAITYPPLGRGDKAKLVGSAEQSFIYEDLRGYLPQGKFVACSPCVRKEDHYDDIHRHMFMKVELYQNNAVNEDSLQKIIQDAKTYFEYYLYDGHSERIAVDIVETAEGYDLEVEGIEVGSYGIRSYYNMHWICGTGLALPRFSAAAKKYFSKFKD